MPKKCPICKAMVEDDMVRLCQEAEDWIVGSIRRAHPEWVQKDGSCAKCMDYYKGLGKSEEE
jgi:hypothetical protein